MNLPSGSVKYYFRNRDDVLADILADHEVALSQRVGAAYDATARAGPVTPLAALVEAFYRSVLAAADAHRAMLFSTALLPAEPQAWVKARYRALLDSFAETLGELAPEVPAGAVADILVPTLERLLSGVVLWNVPGEHDADPHYPRMVTAMMVAATRTITAEALAERAERSGPGWLAELAPAGVPAKSGRSYVPRAAESSAERTERPEAAGARRGGSPTRTHGRISASCWRRPGPVRSSSSPATAGRSPGSDRRPARPPRRRPGNTAVSLETDRVSVCCLP
jgi:AcrR family transcriptional regulator